MKRFLSKVKVGSVSSQIQKRINKNQNIWYKKTLMEKTKPFKILKESWI